MLLLASGAVEIEQYQVSACWARPLPGSVMRCSASSHWEKSALAKAITASSSSGSCATSLTSTAKGLPKSLPSAGLACAGLPKDTASIGAKGGRPAAICTGAGAEGGGSCISARGGRAGRLSSSSASSGMRYEGFGGGAERASTASSVGAAKAPGGLRCVLEKPGSPTICCSISSILAFTPSGREGPPSGRRASESSMRDDPPREASCSGDRPSRRTRRSMSNSRLRTTSLRRLRSIMALSSDFSISSSRVSSCRELRSVQSVAGFATNRTTLRKKLSFSAMGRKWYSGAPQCRAALWQCGGQSPNIFCLSSRRCCASSDKVAVGRASKRGRPMGSPVSSQ